MLRWWLYAAKQQTITWSNVDQESSHMSVNDLMPTVEKASAGTLLIITNYAYTEWVIKTLQHMKTQEGYLGPLLLTWFNFNPSMDK